MDERINKLIDKFSQYPSFTLKYGSEDDPEIKYFIFFTEIPSGQLVKVDDEILKFALDELYKDEPLPFFIGVSSKTKSEQINLFPDWQKEKIISL